MFSNFDNNNNNINNNLNNPNNPNNGRLPELKNYKAGKPYQLYQNDINATQTPYNKEAIRNLQSDSVLSRAYFSQQNINIIQNAIRHQVWLQSNNQKIISNQSEVEIQIVMRSIYLQYARNLPNQIKEQISDLNKRVVNYCVPIIMSNMTQYQQYRRDVSQLPVPQAHPQQVSNAGSKTLELDASRIGL